MIMDIGVFLCMFQYECDSMTCTKSGFLRKQLINQCTLTSSGANSLFSLTLTGATSSMLIDGWFEMIFTSGAA